MKNSMRFILTVVSFVAVSLLAAELRAQDTSRALPLDPSLELCRNVVPINEIPGGGVLYKSENIHGGRGPSFLVQNVAERTNKQAIEIRNARCELIGYLGLFKTDQPYGSRYYSATGGSGYEADQLLAFANEVGSDNILIEGVNKWIRVKSPLLRDGSVRK